MGGIAVIKCESAKVTKYKMRKLKRCESMYKMRKVKNAKITLKARGVPQPVSEDHEYNADLRTRMSNG